MSGHHRIRFSVFSAAAAALLLLAAMAEGAFAQKTTSVKLFDAVPVVDSGPLSDPSLATSFGEKQLVLACDKTPVVTISSTPDGTKGFVVDNFLSVDGVNVCTGQVDCGTLGNCSSSCFRGFLANTGDALTSYIPVPPLDISGNLAAGKHLMTFELNDWGVLLGSSDIWLMTNCSVPPQVAICHKPGTPAARTLLVAQSAVPGHLGHGDTLEPCP